MLKFIFILGKDVLGYEMKLGWGKSVIIPALPIYIPPSLLELSQPPHPSGLPFNAQPQAKDKDVLPKSQDELNDILSRSVVKVVMPTDRYNLLLLLYKLNITQPCNTFKEFVNAYTSHGRVCGEGRADV